MKQGLSHRWFQGLHHAVGALLATVLMTSAALANPGIPWQFEPYSASPDGVNQAPENTEVELILDDGIAEGTFGISDANARQFLWFNQFSLEGLNQLTVEEIQVLFTPGPNMAVGNAIQLVVYHDSDADPTNGAQLLATFDETIEVLDGITFSTYPLPDGVSLPRGGYALIGVVPRFIETGTTSPTQPAALDTSTSQGQSWVAVWNTDPPTDPDLPPDLFLDQVDVFTPGNWMIRAFANPRVIVEIPTLDGKALAVLALLLGGMGIWRVRRRLVS